MFNPEVPTSFSLTDIFLFPFYFSFIIFVFWQYRKTKTENHYKFFIPGLAVKLLASVFFCYVYLYFYKEGGDTLYYFYSAKVLANLFFENPYCFFKIVLWGDVSGNAFSFFNNYTGWPLYSNDYFTFFFVRLITPFVFLSFGSYLVCSLLLASVAYLGIWKLFTTLVKIYPELTSPFAISILFIPSVVFWSSGILKDTITIPALALCVSCLFAMMQQNKFLLKKSVVLAVFSFLLLSIKPYILYAFLTASAIWLLIYYLKKINVLIIRYVYFPIILSVVFTMGFVFLFHIGQEKGRFSLDNLEELSQFANKDLKREAYQGSAFNIGEPGKDFSSKIKLAPAAVNAVLFRPYLWEARNAMMIFSAVENLILLVLTIYAAIKLWKNRAVFNIPFVWFLLTFALLFAFSVGISISNFGTLVRLKSPMMPYFLLSVFYIIYWENPRKEFR